MRNPCKSNVGLITIWHVNNCEKYYENCYVPNIMEYLVLMAITPSTNIITRKNVLIFIQLIM
jgi:hypothetical protein